MRGLIRFLSELFGSGLGGTTIGILIGLAVLGVLFTFLAKPLKDKLGLSLSDLIFYAIFGILALIGAMYNAKFLLVLFGGILGSIGLYKLLFGARSTDAIIKAHEDDEGKYVAKYPEANIYKFSAPFFLTGLLISMGFVMASFLWAEQPEEIMSLGEIEMVPEIEQLPPPSIQRPPPPPPPPPPPKLEIVEDEEIIEEDEPEIQELEVEEETVVEIPEEIFEEVVEEVEEEVVEEVIEEEEPEEPEIFTIVEDMPEFPGGQKELFKFLGKQTQYPPMARENGIEGTVYVGFVVLEDGSISSVHIKRGLPGGGAGCDQEAIRVVGKMPKWKPGKQRGKPVRVAYTLPFKFKLE